MKSSRKWRDDTKMDLWINVVWIECVEFRPGVVFSTHRNGGFQVPVKWGNSLANWSDLSADEERRGLIRTTLCISSIRISVMVSGVHWKVLTFRDNLQVSSSRVKQSMKKANSLHSVTEERKALKRDDSYKASHLYVEQTVPWRKSCNVIQLPAGVWRDMAVISWSCVAHVSCLELDTTRPCLQENHEQDTPVTHAGIHPLKASGCYTYHQF